jgi:hypothetical protein
VCVRERDSYQRGSAHAGARGRPKPSEGRCVWVGGRAAEGEKQKKNETSKCCNVESAVDRDDAQDHVLRIKKKAQEWV